MPRQYAREYARELTLCYSVEPCVLMHSSAAASRIFSRCLMSHAANVPALSIPSALSASSLSAQQHVVPASTAPADIAAALPGFLPAILAAVRSRSVNSAALVRDKVKRSRRTSPRFLQYLFVTLSAGTDDDGLLLLALDEYLQFHQSGGDVHLAEQSLWAIVWLRTRAASLPVDMAHFSPLVDLLLCREKFAPLARLLRRVLQRVEHRHGESSPEFFGLLQHILEVQFWAGDLKEADATATHLGRMRDKYAPSILPIQTAIPFIIPCS